MANIQSSTTTNRGFIFQQSLWQHFVVARKKVFFVRAVVQSCKVFVNGYSQSATEVPRVKVAPGSSEK